MKNLMNCFTMSLMKTLLLTLCLSLPASAAFAQGSIVFANESTNLVMQYTNQTDPTLIRVPRSGGCVQLFWAQAGTPYTPWTPALSPAIWRASNPGWSYVGYTCGAGGLTNVPPYPTPISRFLAGYFSGGSQELGNGYSSGSDYIEYVVTGWTDTNYVSFDDAYDAAVVSNAMVGVSSLCMMRTGKVLTRCDSMNDFPEWLSTSFSGLVLAPLSAAPPAFYSQPSPQAQTATIGSTVCIRCVAYGFPTPVFQWYLNGTNAVPDATNEVLVLTGLHSWQSGSYTVVASNLAGPTTSQPALVNVYPTLGINMVPAITLNGDVGLTYNLDCINAVGPTNSWVTLATVTITNNPQLYFDVSAVGQPTRLYRLVQVP